MGIIKRQRKPGYHNSSTERISRHNEWSRSRNTLFCVACLRKIKHEPTDFHFDLNMECPYCGSTSPKFIKSWIDRTPRRTASKHSWRKFLKKKWYFWHNLEPKDFMKNV